MLDVLIRSGNVIDGAGNPWIRADVGIADGRIVAVGKLTGELAQRTIDADGLCVCPGFHRYAHALRPAVAGSTGMGSQTGPGRHTGGPWPGRARPRPADRRRHRHFASAAQGLEWRSARDCVDVADSRGVPRPVRRSGGAQRGVPGAPRNGADAGDGRGQSRPDGARTRRDASARGSGDGRRSGRTVGRPDLRAGRLFE